MQSDRTSCFVHTLLEKHKQERAVDVSPEGEIAARKTDKGPPDSSNAGSESRMLTKRQLSDMAFGIRELSKKLAHIRLKLNVRNVFLLTKLFDSSLVANTREVAEWLFACDAQRPYTV